MGYRWKRLLKPVKNFEKFFDFDLTWSSGTPPKDTRGLPKPTFIKRSKRCHVGCRLKRLLKPVKNF